MIRLNNVTKIYTNTPVLNDISAFFEKGKAHGIVGRNGSGKTVLLKCICGLIPPTSGVVSINGKIIGKDVDVPPSTGVIIEKPGFIPNYSGYTNLKFLSMICKKIKPQDIKLVMTKVGLNADSKKHVGQYSLGMRQRLGIAQAIMENPDLLVLDEPLSGLDDKGIDEMRSLFHSLREKGTTIVLATHDVNDIRILCDHVYKINDGVLFQLQ